MKLKCVISYIAAAICLAHITTAIQLDCNMPPKRVDSESCCLIPSFISNEVQKKCQPIQPFFCALNVTGIFSDNNLNETQLTGYLNVVYKGRPEVISTVEKSFKTCAAKLEAYRAGSMGFRRHNRGNTAAARRNGNNLLSHGVDIRFVACLYMEAFMECPSSIWTNTQECNDRREFLKSCRASRRYWHWHHVKEAVSEAEDEHEHTVEPKNNDGNFGVQWI